MDRGAALVLLLLWTNPAMTTASTQAGLSLLVSSWSEVLLPCAAPEGADLKTLALEWSRSDLQENYVFLFRDGRPFLVYQHPQFKGRVELVDPTLRSGDLSIRLHHAQPSDSGRFECHFFSQSHARRRAVYDTQPIRTIELTVRGPEPVQIQAYPGQDVVLPADKVDFTVTSLVWKRQDDPEHFVYLMGMGHPHHQHPLYSGRTELRLQTEHQVLNQTKDLSMILRRVQPSDTGTYCCHIIQSQQPRVKRHLHQSEPYGVVILSVASSGVLRYEVSIGFVAAVSILPFLQIWN